MNTLLTRIEYACFALSIGALFFVLFLVGDTDMLSEPAPWVTTVLMGLACLTAVVGAALHWIGLPKKDAPKKKPKKK